MLELAILGLLKERPMYGYELKKLLGERLGHFRSFSYGSLYPTLKKLAHNDAVLMEYPTGEVRRRKNVYRITAKGEATFERLIEESGPHAAEDRDAFMLRYAFFRYTRPETRRRLLERRRGYVQDQLERIKTSLRNLRERMDAYSLELMRYGELEAEHDIRWLDEMIEAERNAERSARRTRKRPTKANVAAIEPKAPVAERG